MKATLRCLLVIGLLLVLSGCSGVRFVDKLEIVNDTSYTANVDVRGRTGGWLGLTMVRAGETDVVEDVIDQGDRWTFRFAYGGSAVETMTTRTALADSDWQVEVPEEFEERLQDEGVLPPP